MKTSGYMSMGKQFAMFAIIVFVGMFIGGYFSALLLPYTGTEGTLVGSGVGFVLSVLPAWYLLKKFGKKSVT